MPFLLHRLQSFIHLPVFVCKMCIYETNHNKTKVTAHLFLQLTTILYAHLSAQTEKNVYRTFLLEFHILQKQILNFIQ